MPEAGFDQQRPRRLFLIIRHEQAARKGADGALQRAHMLIGDKHTDARCIEQGFDGAEQHRIIGAQNFTHERAKPFPLRRIALHG